jgi:membrane protein implicated in regulation of membrane protease activity
LLAALAGLVLAAVLAALTALTTTLATLMLLAGPVLSALSALAALAAALLRTLLLVVTLRVVLLVRHWEILRCLFGNAPPRRNVINARQKLKRRKPVTTDTVNEL